MLHDCEPSHWFDMFFLLSFSRSGLQIDQKRVRPNLKKYAKFWPSANHTQHPHTHTHTHTQPTRSYTRIGTTPSMSRASPTKRTNTNTQTIHKLQQQTNSKGGVAAWPDVPKQTGTLGNLTPADRHGSVQVRVFQPLPVSLLWWCCCCCCCFSFFPFFFRTIISQRLLGFRKTK